MNGSEILKTHVPISVLILETDDATFVPTRTRSKVKRRVGEEMGGGAPELTRDRAEEQS